MSRTYRVDVDGTIATPLFFHESFEQCARSYIEEGIVKPEEITPLQFHQQLFLLPHVLITHRAIEGAVQALQALKDQGRTLQYFTVRQNIDPVVCEQVHSNTCVWLEQQQFPYPMETRFFWSVGEKLTASLEATEEEVVLIDDRPDGLVKAFEAIVQSDPTRAQQIQRRLTVMAFGYAETQAFSQTDLRVVPLENWSKFRC